MTVPALKRQIRIEPEILIQALSELEGKGIYRWPAARGKARFWCAAAEAFVEGRILAIASECALPLSGLAQKVRRQAHGYPEKLVRAQIQHLLKEKHLRKYPAFGREAGLLGRTGNPEAYAAAARLFVEKIAEKVRAEGGSLETGAPSQDAASVEDQILGAMVRREPAGSAPVSVRDLRMDLAQVDKASFDSAALALRAQRRVFLSRHDFPQSLPAGERDLLIDGQDGSYYVALTERRD